MNEEGGSATNRTNFQERRFFTTEARKHGGAFNAVRQSLGAENIQLLFCLLAAIPLKSNAPPCLRASVVKTPFLSGFRISAHAPSYHCPS
jgi:hypothetical protein